MIFAHSLWLGPLLKGRWNIDVQRQLVATFNFALLSAHWIKRCGYRIDLHTDEYGYEMFKGTNIYDAIIIDQCHNTDERFWAQSKVKALDQFTCHIDMDVIIRSKDVCSLIEYAPGGIVCQYLEDENDAKWYDKPMHYINNVINFDAPGDESLAYMLEPMQYACNCGVIYIKDSKLCNAYKESYTKLLNLCKSSTITCHTSIPDVAIEQVNLYRLAQMHNQPICCIRNKDNIATFEYEHLIGKQKFEPESMTKVAIELATEFKIDTRRYLTILCQRMQGQGVGMDFDSLWRDITYKEDEYAKELFHRKTGYAANA